MDSADEMDSDNDRCSSPEMSEEAKPITMNIVPEKSRRMYTNCYNDFIKWCEEKNATSLSEDTFLNYFSEMSQKYNSATLWARFSMLKATVYTYKNIDISRTNYKKLSAFLKKIHRGHKSKRSKVFTNEDIIRFCNEAPDKIYLATKVALIIGVTGAFGNSDLADLKMDHVQDHNTIYLITFPKAETDMQTTFTITDQFYKICKKYVQLRPTDSHSNRFFLRYQSGKCSCQPIGKNRFGSMPKEIATFLNLEDPSSYTGHAFRRTSKTREMKKNKRCQQITSGISMRLSTPPLDINTEVSSPNERKRAYNEDMILPASTSNTETLLFSPDLKRRIYAELYPSEQNDQLFSTNNTHSDSEKEFASQESNRIEGKHFAVVDSCCVKRCYLIIDATQQESFFNEFWNCGDYQKQTDILRRCLECKAQKANKDKIIWTYTLTCAGESVKVCKRFFLDVLSVGKRRIECLQNKISSGYTFEDDRSKEKPNPIPKVIISKISSEVKELIKIHCSKINYFDYPGLNLESLYDLFLKYYAATTGNKKIPLSRGTYCNFLSIARKEPPKASVGPLAETSSKESCADEVQTKTKKKSKSVASGNKGTTSDDPLSTNNDGFTFVNIDSLLVKDEPSEIEEFHTDPAAPMEGVFLDNVKDEVDREEDVDINERFCELVSSSTKYSSKDSPNHSNMPRNNSNERLISIDFDYFMRQFHRAFDYHASSCDCRIRDLEYIKTSTVCLKSLFSFRCKKCNYTGDILSESVNSEM